MKKILLAIVSTIIMTFQVIQAQGDAEAGKTKAEVCATCHGPAGNSVTPEWPKLAGQHAAYIGKQLSDFKSGVRKNPTMSPMAAPLSEQDMADLGTFYAAQNRTTDSADPELVKAGEKLYRGGNSETGVPACMACHGPAGAGNPAAGFPALSGQHAAYTAIQLQAYKSGERTNDKAGMMRTIAGRMSDAEIKAVSSYIAGLH
jgi:cytochrome c553